MAGKKVTQPVSGEVWLGKMSSEHVCLCKSVGMGTRSILYSEPHAPGPPILHLRALPALPALQRVTVWELCPPTLQLPQEIMRDFPPRSPTLATPEQSQKDLPTHTLLIDGCEKHGTEPEVPSLWTRVS